MGLGALWRDFKDDLLTYRTVKVRFFLFWISPSGRESERFRGLFSPRIWDLLTRREWRQFWSIHQRLLRQRQRYRAVRTLYRFLCAHCARVRADVFFLLSLLLSFVSKSHLPKLSLSLSLKTARSKSHTNSW